MILNLHAPVKVSHILSSVDPFVKTFIIADSLFYSSLNFVTPLFALFVTLDITNGNIQIAAYALTASFVARIITELTVSAIVTKLSERRKVVIVICGLLIITGSYFGFAITNQISHLYILWSAIGFAQGLIFPAKLSIFSRHLDKGKEATEWGVSDALNMSLIALTTALGGFVAHNYGFKVLFMLASITSLLGIMPYFLYYRRANKLSS